MTTTASGRRLPRAPGRTALVMALALVLAVAAAVAVAVLVLRPAPAQAPAVPPQQTHVVNDSCNGVRPGGLC